MKEENKKYLIVIIMLLVFFIVFFFINSISSNNDKKELIDDNNLLKDLEKDILLKDLEKTINKNNMNEYNNIYIYSINNINNQEYIYVKLDDKVSTIYECFKDNDNYNCYFFGNRLNTHKVSEHSGYTYIELTDPEGYKLEKELEELREQAKTAKPDGDLDWK